MNCQPIKDILGYHKTAMPYTRRGQQQKIFFLKFSFKVCYTTRPQWSPFKVYKSKVKARDTEHIFVAFYKLSVINSFNKI